MFSIVYVWGGGSDALALELNLHMLQLLVISSDVYWIIRSGRKALFDICLLPFICMHSTGSACMHSTGSACMHSTGSACIVPGLHACIVPGLHACIVRGVHACIVRGLHACIVPRTNIHARRVEVAVSDI